MSRQECRDVPASRSTPSCRSRHYEVEIPRRTTRLALGGSVGEEGVVACGLAAASCRLGRPLVATTTGIDEHHEHRRGPLCPKPSPTAPEERWDSQPIAGRSGSIGGDAPGIPWIYALFGHTTSLPTPHEEQGIPQPTLPTNRL